MTPARHLASVHLLAGALLVAAPAATRAQGNGNPCAAQSPGGGARSGAPAMATADVKSIDGILGALYDVISGPAGQTRDWNRFRNLFAPGARLIPTVYRPDSLPVLRVMDPEQYIERAAPRLEESGFFEKEVARRTERFCGVAHVFSTYESRRAATDKKPFVRGINSIQLFNDGTRWWIVSVYWESERPTSPLPAKYLKK